MQKYVSQTIKSILEESKTLLSPQSYVDNKRKRIELANFYKKILHSGASFPERPADMTESVVRALYKDVSNSCPDCVKHSVMLQTVKNVIRLVFKYVNELKKLDLEDLEKEEMKSVHDLRPNI
jgi:hypothetical protein